jgi:hypothetical protein
VGWTQRVSLTIQHGKVPANQTAFPVLLTEATLPAAMLTLGGPGAAQSDGGDIRFSTDILGASQIACEIVVWTQNASPASAKAEIWVPVNVLTASDVTIYVWYSAGGAQTQPAAGAAFGSQAVWDANYMAVWHLANGTSLALTDSTSNAVTLTNNNAWGAGAAQIDGGTNKSNGSGQYLFNASLASPTSITFSCWEKVLTADVGTDALLFLGTSDAPQRALLHAPFSDSKIYWDWNNAGAGRISSNYAAFLNVFAYVTVTYDNGSGVHNIFVNGISQATTTAVLANPGKTGVWLNTYKSPDTGGKRILDEPRLSNIARSVNWTLTEYNNQSDPATFVIPGSPAPVGGAPSRSLIGVGQ